MNKKFFTLVLGVFLSVFAFTTANAQMEPVKFLPNAKLADASSLISAENIRQCGGRYVIDNGTEQLVVEKTASGDYIYKWVASASGNVDLFAALWEVEFVKEATGSEPFTMRFYNARYGVKLAFNADKPGVLRPDGAVDAFFFVNSDKKPNGTGGADAHAIYARINNTTEVFALQKTNDPLDAVFKRVDGSAAPKEFLVKEQPVIKLTAAQLNKLSETSDEFFKLCFNEGPKSQYKTPAEQNIWTATALHASEVTVGTPGDALYIQPFDVNTGKVVATKYITVANDYHNTGNMRSLKFAYNQKHVALGYTAPDFISVDLSAAEKADWKKYFLVNGTSLRFKGSETDATGYTDAEVAVKLNDGDKFVLEGLAFLKAQIAKNVHMDGTGITDFDASAANLQAWLDAKGHNLDLRLFNKKLNLVERQKFVFNYYPTRNALVITTKDATGVAGYNGVLADKWVPTKGIDAEDKWVDAYFNAASVVVEGQPLTNLMNGTTAAISIEDLGSGRSEVTFRQHTGLPSIYNQATIDLHTNINLLGLGLGKCCSKPNVAQPEEGAYRVERIVKEKDAYHLVDLVIPIWNTGPAVSYGYTAFKDDGVVEELYEENQDYNRMPAAQWILYWPNRAVGSIPLDKTRYSLFNREFDGVKLFDNIWLEKVTVKVAVVGGKTKDVEAYMQYGADLATELKAGRVFVLTPLAPEFATDPYLGYKHFTEEQLDDRTLNNYKMRYLHESMAIQENYLTDKEFTDSIVDVSKNALQLAYEVAGKEAKYGFGKAIMNPADTIPGVVTLKRQSYYIQARDARKTSSFRRYVAEVKKLGKPTKYAWNVDNVTYWEPRTPLYFKLNYTVDKKDISEDQKDFYALFQPANEGSYRAGLYRPDAELHTEAVNTKTVTTFSVEPYKVVLYRTFNDKKLESQFKENMDDPTIVEFFERDNENRQLFEDANSKYARKSTGNGWNKDSKDRKEDKMNNRTKWNDQINYLGLHSIKEEDHETAMFVDPAYLYDSKAKGAGYVWTKKAAEKPQYLIGVRPTIVGVKDEGCGVTKRGFIRADYLIAPWAEYLTYDKVTNPYGPFHKNTMSGKRYEIEWNRDYEKLVFMDAVHIGDSLYINFSGEKFSNDEVTVEFLDKLVTEKKMYRRNLIKDNTHKPEVYSFRLYDDGDAKDFLIESYGKDAVVGPYDGLWLKAQNEVPVLTRDGADLASAIANPFILNVKGLDKTVEDVVANEAIATTEFRVVAENGALNILNAAGKRVVVSNILGQTVANTVLSSDNATVEVPAGIVVVAVEGEAAVKAIVR